MNNNEKNVCRDCKLFFPFATGNYGWRQCSNADDGDEIYQTSADLECIMPDEFECSHE